MSFTSYTTGKKIIQVSLEGQFGSIRMEEELRLILFSSTFYSLPL